MTNTNSYEPYGEEWKKEMMKLPKAVIIDLFREAKLFPDHAELLAKIEEIDRNKSIWPNEHFYELRRWLTQSKEKAA